MFGIPTRPSIDRYSLRPIAEQTHQTVKMIRTLKVNEKEQHPVKSVYGEVSRVMQELGYDVDLIGELSGEEHIHERDVGLTLDLSEDVCNLIRDGRLPFTLEKHLDGHFGESTGSANVTTLKIKRDLNIEEVLQVFHKTGQLDDAIEMIDFLSDDKHDAELILAYAISQYAKGWLAEEIVSSAGLLNKGSVSQDKGGIDGWFEGDKVQIGSITRVNSKKKQMEASEIRHLIYQWTHDGELVIGDIDDVMSENKRIAKDAELSATLTRRTAGNLKINKEVGRSFRYLWW